MEDTRVVERCENSDLSNAFGRSIRCRTDRLHREFLSSPRVEVTVHHSEGTTADAAAPLECSQTEIGQFGGEGTNLRPSQSNRQSRTQFDAKELVGQNAIAVLKEEVISALAISIALVG
jgi:hypothetical protein